MTWGLFFFFFNFLVWGGVLGKSCFGENEMGIPMDFGVEFL